MLHKSKKVVKCDPTVDYLTFNFILSYEDTALRVYGFVPPMDADTCKVKYG
jgi:hypothetical protein